MNHKALYIGVVLFEIALIVALAAYIVRGRTYAVSITPFSQRDVTRATSSRLLYYYDLAGEQKTAVPDWLPYEVTYVRNNDQLNDRFDYAVEKPPGTYRIITLGDSWGFGMHVSTKDNYSELLEDKLQAGLADGSLICSGISKFEVLNFGVGGYDIEYMVERLRLKGMKYSPDLIIPIIKVDDFVLVNEMFQKKLRALYAAYGDLQARVVDGARKNPRQELSLEVEKELLNSYRAEDLDAYEAAALASLPTFYRGAALFFVYGQLSENQREILRSFARKNGRTRIYDETLPLSSEEKVPYDEHPGVQGHARFADELYRFLVEEKIIPCRVLQAPIGR